MMTDEAHRQIREDLKDLKEDTTKILVTVTKMNVELKQVKTDFYDHQKDSDKDGGVRDQVKLNSACRVSVRNHLAVAWAFIVGLVGNTIRKGLGL